MFLPLILALASALKSSVREVTGKVKLIQSTFEQTGIFPWNPTGTVLARVPAVYPPPEEMKGRSVSMEDVAGYTRTCLSYEQTKYVREAREKGEKIAAEAAVGLVQQILSDAAEIAEHKGLQDVAGELRQKATASSALLSPEQVFL